MNSKSSSIEWKIPLYKIYTDDEDLNLITKIIKRGTYWSMGPEIEELENLIKEYVGANYCLTFNSGTSALHALLLAYKIMEGDEVIVPSWSFISTANSVLFVKGIPVFSDIEESNFGLDPKLISQKITSKTKAIIPMDYSGLSCKIDEIKEVAQENKLFLIEDAAEALGASVNGKKVGTLSNSAMFSFCGNKVFTTGEGGAVITDSKEIYEKLKLIRSHGRVDKGSYFDDSSASQYLALGFNWRMSTITAVLGISQLGKLDKIIKMRQNNAKLISSSLSKIPQIKTPSAPEGYEHIYQMYTIRLPNQIIRDKLQKFLKEKKIFSKVYFNPIHLTDYYKEKFSTKKGMLPVTEKISEQVLSLPIYPNMTSEEKMYLTDSISEFFESNNKN